MGCRGGYLYPLLTPYKTGPTPYRRADDFGTYLYTSGVLTSYEDCYTQRRRR